MVELFKIYKSSENTISITGNLSSVLLEAWAILVLGFLSSFTFLRRCCATSAVGYSQNYFQRIQIRYWQLTWKRRFNMLRILPEAFQLSPEGFINHGSDGGNAAVAVHATTGIVWESATSAACIVIVCGSSSNQRIGRYSVIGRLHLNEGNLSKCFPIPRYGFPLFGILFPVSIFWIRTWFFGP